jgi:hypothetical protein
MWRLVVLGVLACSGSQPATSTPSTPPATPPPAPEVFDQRNCRLELDADTSSTSEERIQRYCDHARSPCCDRHETHWDWGCNNTAYLYRMICTL